MELMNVVRAQWDRSAAVVCTLAGVVLLTLGWYGVSGSAYPAEQIPHVVSQGLGGLFLLGLAAVLWLSADLRDEWRKLDGIEQAIREHGLPSGDASVVSNGQGELVSSGGRR